MKSPWPIYILTAIILYMLYSNDAAWYWYAVVLVIAGISTKAIIDNDAARENDLKRLEEKGIDISKLIPMGTYLGGHPGLDHLLNNVRGYFNSGKLELFATFRGDHKEARETAKQAEIPVAAISDLAIEDKTTIEKRVSVGRLILFGPLALGMRKKQKSEEAYLCVVWSDGKFKHETLFRLPNMERANTARNALIKICQNEIAVA